VDIAVGATVTSSYISFDVDEVRPDQSDVDVTISIYGEANASPAAPSTADFDMSSRTPTTASVMWQPEASVNVHDELKTPDITPILTEIISMDGWAQGNPVCIMFGHTSGDGVRWVESNSVLNDVQTPALVFNTDSVCGGSCGTSNGFASVSNPLDSAEEDVTEGTMYLDSSDLEIMHDGEDSMQIVGITFPSVDLSPNSNAVWASVVFDIDEVRPGQSDVDVTVSIFGELNANPAAPTTDPGDLSSRTPTKSAVIWQPPASVGVHEMLYTPDISSVVNEITALPGWLQGNPMTILFGHMSGTGVRWVESNSVLSADQTQGNGEMQTPALWYTVAGLYHSLKPRST
jgi:hypothetical protein